MKPTYHHSGLILHQPGHSAGLMLSGTRPPATRRLLRCYYMATTRLLMPGIYPRLTEEMTGSSLEGDERLMRRPSDGYEQMIRDDAKTSVPAQGDDAPSRSGQPQNCSKRSLDHITVVITFNRSILSKTLHTYPSGALKKPRPAYILPAFGYGKSGVSASYK